jgi:hypothetical protein
MTTTEIQNLQNGILGLAGAKPHDQSDAEAGVAALEKACASMLARLPAGVTIAAPQKGDDVLANLGELIRYHRDLEAALASPHAAKASGTKPQNLTDKVLAARGCKTLSELAKLPASQD